MGGRRKGDKSPPLQNGDLATFGSKSEPISESIMLDKSDVLGSAVAPTPNTLILGDSNPLVNFFKNRAKVFHFFQKYFLKKIKNKKK